MLRLLLLITSVLSLSMVINSLPALTETQLVCWLIEPFNPPPWYVHWTYMHPCTPGFFQYYNKWFSAYIDKGLPMTWNSCLKRHWVATWMSGEYCVHIEKSNTSPEGYQRVITTHHGILLPEGMNGRCLRCVFFIETGVDCWPLYKQQVVSLQESSLSNIFQTWFWLLHCTWL